MLDELADTRALEVAHELRDPLTVVSLSAQLMLRRRVYDEAALIRIVGATERLNRLTGDLADVSLARPTPMDSTPTARGSDRRRDRATVGGPADRGA
jgi:signal transduction histidine kinase